MLLECWSIAGAQAESDSDHVVYQGVSFRVEQRLTAGGNLIKIVLAGKPFLVSELLAPRQVALRYLNHPELSQRLSTAELQALVLAADQSGDAEVLKTAIQVGLVREGPSEFDSEELWKKLVLHSERVAVVWSAVSEVIHRAPLGRVCLAGAAIEHDNDRYLSEQLAQSCLEQVHREAIEKALKGDDLNQIIIDLHRRSVTFAPHAIHGASKAFELDQLLQDLSRAFDQGDLNLFQSSLSSLVVRGEALGMASDATPLQYAFISRLVAQGAYMRALRQIVSLPFEERKPETHANLLKALAGLQIADVSVLEDSQIRAALLRYAAKDEEIYAEWLRIHYQLIEDLLRAGARDSARHIANRLREENPSIALPIALKLKLALGWGSIWCFLLLLFGVCLFATRFRWFKKQSRVPDALSETKVCSDDSEPERAPHSEEYTNLLRVFGLEPGVDLSEIKNAYRSAVKQIHPDLQGADSIRDTGSFVKLTSDYRRLLELHEHD